METFFLFPWLKQILIPPFSFKQPLVPYSISQISSCREICSVIFFPRSLLFKKIETYKNPGILLSHFINPLELGISKIMSSLIKNNIFFLFLLFHNVGIIDLSYQYDQNLSFTLNYWTMNGQHKGLFYLFYSLLPIPPHNIL